MSVEDNVIDDVKKSEMFFQQSNMFRSVYHIGKVKGKKIYNLFIIGNFKYFS